MLRWISICLLALGVLLCVPVLHVFFVWVEGGAPDATALSLSAGSLTRAGVGSALVIGGLALFAVRFTRRTPTKST